MINIKELKDSVNSRYDYLGILYSLFYDIEKALKNRNNDDINIISGWIDESIEDYFTYEMEQAISTAKEWGVGRQCDYEKFFEPTNWEGGGEEWKPIENEIVFELGVSTPDNTSDNEALQQVLNYIFEGDIPPLKEVKDYEIMAVMALKHIQSSMKNSNEKLQRQEAEDLGFDKFDFIDDFIYSKRRSYKR